jgi:hypothetical protein
MEGCSRRHAAAPRRTSGASTSAPPPSPACAPCSPLRRPGAQGLRHGGGRTASARINHVRYRASRWRCRAIPRRRAARPMRSSSVRVPEPPPMPSARWRPTPELHPTPRHAALAREQRPLRHVRIRRGPPPRPTSSSGEYEVGMQDHKFLGLESPSRCPAAGGVDPSRHPVAARDQGQVAESLGLAREGAPHARRRGRRVRRARGPLDADPRLHARPAHEPSAADGLQPRGVLLRPRPPPPVHHALRARRHARRAPGLRTRADRARRRRLRLELDRGVRQRRLLRRRPLRAARASTPRLQ